MKIKDYQCKCGRSDFYFNENGGQTGIYCTYCGRWLKWANKDEQNLRWIDHQKTEKTNNDFMLELFNHIADYDSVHICTKEASKYVKEYWKHKNIKICVTRNKIDREIISITLTKF